MNKDEVLAQLRAATEAHVNWVQKEKLYDQIKSWR